MEAARFLVSHNVAYQHLRLNEEEACRQFGEAGMSCAAVRAQATAVEAEEGVPIKLSGPADTTVDGTETLRVDEVEVVDEEVSVPRGSGAEEDPFGEEGLPAFRCAAGEVGSGDLDVERCFKEFAAKLKLLMGRQQGEGRGMVFETEVDSFRRLAESMSSADLQAKLDKLVREMDIAEGNGSGEGNRKTVQVVHTGSVPLSMYSPEYWQKCFPELFPYGDGVYGLVRDTPLTFREWACYFLERAELEYEIAEQGGVSESSSSGLVPPATSERNCSGPEGGLGGGDAFQPPAVPRWAADLNFVAVACDTWKRMEMVRLASAHVKRKKFKESLKAVMQCTSERLGAAMTALGENASMGDVMRSSVVDERLRDAISQLLFFSAEVVGTDGARQQLRHEQNGAMLMSLGLFMCLVWLTRRVRRRLWIEFCLVFSYEDVSLQEHARVLRGDSYFFLVLFICRSRVSFSFGAWGVGNAWGSPADCCIVSLWS